MFERYTEKTRRAIFYARHKASELGWQEICSECLLLGTLREDNTIAERWLEMRPEDIRKLIVSRTPPAGQKFSTSVNLPISDEARADVCPGRG